LFTTSQIDWWNSFFKEKIYNGVYSTGELGSWIKEQALVINTERGLVMITGCAHPGIVNMVKKVKELFKKDIALVIGGFHLINTNKNEIERIVLEFKKLGVKYVAPCHCSGDIARGLFKRAYGNNFINVGTGSTISIDGLK